MLALKVKQKALTRVPFIKAAFNSEIILGRIGDEN